MYNEHDDLTRRITELITELTTLKENGLIFHYTVLRTPGLRKQIGVEIHFDDDNVDINKLKKVKYYIENKYKFKVDDSKLIPNILLVEYKL